MPDEGGKGFSEMYKPTCHRIVTFLEILFWSNDKKKIHFACYQRFAVLKKKSLSYELDIGGWRKRF
jgi:hypothetical protein